MRTVINVFITSLSSNLYSVPTIYFLIIYTDKFLESYRLRECKSEEIDNAKGGKQNANISENGAL